MKKCTALIVFVVMSLLVPVTGFSGDSTMLSNPAILNPNIQKGSGGGVPVGTVITWPVGSNPEDAENWLECNGQSVSQTAYPELFAVVGGRVPDYQGLFLRGYGSQAHVQNNGSLVGATATLHQSGVLGTIQGDATRNITGTVRSMYRDISGAFWTGEARGDWTTGYTFHGYLAHLDVSRVAPTASENRPANMAVRYLIRAKS